jgi:hypothetical protein
MRDHNVLKLTAADLAAIAKWRRAMIAAVALTVAITLTGADLHQRYLAPLFAPTIASAESQTPVLSQECALRDGQYMMQLEQQGDRPGASGPKLYGAFLAMLKARTLCEAGRPKEAFALYDEAFGAFVAPKDLAKTRASVAPGSTARDPAD